MRTLSIQHSTACSTGCSYCYLSKEQREKNEDVGYKYSDLTKLINLAEINYIIISGGDTFAAIDRINSIVESIKDTTVKIVSIPTESIKLSRDYPDINRLNKELMGYGIKLSINFSVKANRVDCLDAINLLDKEIDYMLSLVVSEQMLNNPDDLINTIRTVAEKTSKKLLIKLDYNLVNTDFNIKSVNTLLDVINNTNNIRLPLSSQDNGVASSGCIIGGDYNLSLKLDGSIGDCLAVNSSVGLIENNFNIKNINTKEDVNSIMKAKLDSDKMY